jgi:hypothetical protein
MLFFLTSIEVFSEDVRPALDFEFRSSEANAMKVKINLDPGFSEYTDNCKEVFVEGTTIRECLENFIVRFPIFRTLLFNSDNFLAALVICNGEVIVNRKLDIPLANAREISLRPMFAGG